jgi:Uma2 family endonuclease
MSAQAIVQSLPLAEDTGVQLRYWTREEYHRAAEFGLFASEERLELIHGRIFRKVPQRSQHTMGLRASAETLAAAFGPNFDVRQQLPLVLATDGEPEPDILVVPGSWRDYPNQPTQADVRLLVEISDTTLRYDRFEKGSLYAEAGIADYWIVNLQNRTLEVYRDPAPLPDAQNGFGYRSGMIYLEDGAVTPLAAPQAVLRVADLLPPVVESSQA